jgi:hypothetical protein
MSPLRLGGPGRRPLRARAAGARIGTVLLVFLIAAGFGTVYELCVWVSDQNFGTYYQPNNSDTMTEIAANDVGGLVGGLWLAASATRTWRINRSG